MARRVPLRLGPTPPPPPKPKPFVVLAKPRLAPPGLPSDLAAWYARHEGVGLGDTRHAVNLCKLAEVKPFDFGEEGSRALLIAIVSGTSIVYIQAAKTYRFGTILAMGEAERFVLDANHIGWLARLERDEWFEWGLARDRWKDLQRGKTEALKRHFARLNPGVDQ